MKNLSLIIISLLATFSFADEDLEFNFGEPDHLVPDRSIYAEPYLMDYFLMVSELLPPEDNEEARILVFPSFSPQYAISIQKNEKEYVLEVRQPTKSYWGYKSIESMKNGSIKIIKDGKSQKDQEGIVQLEKEYPNSPRDLPVNKCSRAINSNIAIEMLKILERELFRVKHPDKDSGGFDGTTYHYSMRKGLRTLSGQTWSPSPELPTGKLVSISDSLYQHCINDAPLEKIEHAIKQAQ